MSLANALGVGAVIAAVPAFGGAGDPLGAEDPRATQIELVQGDGVGILAGGLPPGFEALVGLLAGSISQTVAVRLRGTRLRVTAQCQPR